MKQTKEVKAILKEIDRRLKKFRIKRGEAREKRKFIMEDIFTIQIEELKSLRKFITTPK